MNALVARAPEGMNITVLEIGDLPHFNGDLETIPPATVVSAREAVKASDGVLFVTPEYNRSFPGVLKNAIDWLSRPYGANTLAGKPVLVTGATGGAVGTALAQYHLKQVLLYLDTHILGQPELFVGSAEKKFTDGELTDTDTAEHLTKALALFAVHAQKFQV